MLKIDLHMHTVLSGDSPNTALEYINRAKELDMDVIGISDHGPAATNIKGHFSTLNRMPKNINGVRVLKGIEANIQDNEHPIDIPDKVINKLDYVMANLHNNSGYEYQDKKKNTEVIIKAIVSGKIDIITHPFITNYFESDVEKIFTAACENNVLLELDIAYLKEGKIKEDTISNLKKMIEVVKRNGKKVIVNSDSHNIWELGDDSALDKYREEIGLTDEMIINNYKEELFELLGVEE